MIVMYHHVTISANFQRAPLSRENFPPKIQIVETRSDDVKISQATSVISLTRRATSDKTMVASLTTADTENR